MNRLFSAIMIAVLIFLVTGSEAAPGGTDKFVARTLYDGEVAFGLHPSGGYVRRGREAAKWVKYNRDFVAKDASFGPFQRTAEVFALQRAIGVRVSREATPEQVWEAARRILKWHHEHAKYDPDKYDVLMNSGRSREQGAGGWPSIQQIAAYYADHQKLAYAACFSEAHLVFQLFRICGMPTEDFGIASAHYAKDREGTVMREHVYLGLRVGGEWHYIDPSAKLPPPYDRRASIGRQVGEGPGCDYAHPFSFKVVAGARFQAIPLLQPRPAPDSKTTGSKS